MYIDSRNWKDLAYIAAFLAASSLILTILWMPESPRYLYSKKQYGPATQILLRMQKLNNNNPNYKFKLKEIDKDNVITGPNDMESDTDPEEIKIEIAEDAESQSQEHLAKQNER